MGTVLKRNVNERLSRGRGDVSSQDRTSVCRVVCGQRHTTCIVPAFVYLRDKFL